MKSAFIVDLYQSITLNCRKNKTQLAVTKTMPIKQSEKKRPYLFTEKLQGILMNKDKDIDIKALSEDEYAEITNPSVQANSKFNLIQNQWAYYHSDGQCHTYLLIADKCLSQLTKWGRADSLYRQFSIYSLDRVITRSKYNPLRHSIVGPKFASTENVEIEEINEEINNWIKSLLIPRKGNKREFSVEREQQPASKKPRKTEQHQPALVSHKVKPSHSPALFSQTLKLHGSNRPLTAEIYSGDETIWDGLTELYTTDPRFDEQRKNILDLDLDLDSDSDSDSDCWQPDEQYMSLLASGSWYSDQDDKDFFKTFEEQLQTMMRVGVYHHSSDDDHSTSPSPSLSDCKHTFFEENSPSTDSSYDDRYNTTNTSDQDGDEIHENKTEDNGKFLIPPLVVI